MKQRRTQGSKLGIAGERMESYFEGLYEGSYPKTVRTTYKKEQSFLQVPLGEAKFLELLVRLFGPKKILEIGTFRGFSTVFLAQKLSKAGHIWSIERDTTRYEEIRDLWKQTKVFQKITLVRDFALPALKKFTEEKKKFDFFFIDANKEETIEYFKLCYTKLSEKKAIFIIDNTLWGGEVADVNPRSNAATYMKKFNEFIFKKYKKDSYILPIWDGVTIVLKNSK